MLINKKDIDLYGCSLIKYEIGASETQKNIEWTKGALSPLVFLGSNKYKEVKVWLLMESIDRELLELYKSNLAKELEQAIIKFKDSKYLYDGVLGSISFKNINILAIEVVISFKAIQKYDLETIILAKSLTQSINIKGNVDTECIIEVTAPSAAVASFTINNITIKNIPENKTVIIDGIKKKVTVDGSNFFNNVELWEFPILKAGDNTITQSLTTVDVKIKYNPCWN
ncbi:phage distal tail protein [Clostridium sp.]|uniref:phage distal tail protein n=1 Tax=Clostridium sp. TaxID=1506 RepID=UPI00290339EC|nr:hypothetical protein [Clostridium sp.]MDU2283346.1 hypothetical protein [Clostridium sp.]